MRFKIVQQKYYSMVGFFHKRTLFKQRPFFYIFFLRLILNQIIKNQYIQKTEMYMKAQYLKYLRLMSILT